MIQKNKILLYDLATISDVPNGAHSVSEGRVVYGKLDWMKNIVETIDTVCCVIHGAMLNVATTPNGKIWRCPTCNVGAFEDCVNKYNKEVLFDEQTKKLNRLTTS